MRNSILLSVILFFFVCSAKSQSINQTREYLDRVLNALTDALIFFDGVHRSVNLDGAETMRMVEGQLTVLTRRISSNPSNWNIDYDTFSRIQTLSELAGIVSGKATPFIAGHSPVAYRSLGKFLNRGFWELDYASRDIPSSFRIFPYREDEGLRSTTDSCIIELLGSTSGRPPCDIQPSCWVSMTTPGYFGYSLSHQIYWLEIGEINNCSRQMENMRQQYGQPSIPDIQAGMCANMLAETKLIASNGYHYTRRDLFMEDIAFCGMLGFRDFFTPEFVERILSWQDRTHGCYKDILPLPRVRGPLMRTKRAERELRHGCLSHLTGVAIATLAQYVRYLLEFLST